MKKILAMLLLFSLLPLAGCAAQEERVTVMTTFYPLYILAQNVLEGIEGVDVQSMTPPATGCLHDYQLLPRDMRALSFARMLIINGAGMETFLPDVESQFPSLRVVDCSRGIELMEEAEQEEDHHGEDHHHGEYNAHIWLDPQNAIKMAQTMADALADMLPEQAQAIQANAAAYTQMLSQLDEELRAALAPLARRQIVTFHEAFPYFARAYDLEVVAVVALEPDEPVSPKMLADVIQRVKAAGNPPLFSEAQYENAALRAVALETGAPVYELDPLVTGDGSKTAYQDVMRKNLTVLLQALGNQ